MGWGGLSQAFDEKNPDWQKEYTELKGLLSAEDYDNARGSTLNAYYTPKDVIDGIYKALDRFGVKGNNRIAKFISLVRSYTEVNELTPEILNSFIDKIYIGKPERINGQRVQEVKIVYKLVGAVNIPQ